MEKLIASVIIWFLAFGIAGMVELIQYNTYKSVYHNAILIRGDVVSVTSCSSSKKSGTTCNTLYYVDEIFQKHENTTSTCTVRRQTTYYSKGDADNFLSRMKLNTQRTVWQTTWDHGTCYDSKLRQTATIMGSIFLSFGALPLVILLVIVFFEVIYKFYKWIVKCFYNIYISFVNCFTLCKYENGNFNCHCNNCERSVKCDYMFPHVLPYMCDCFNCLKFFNYWGYSSTSKSSTDDRTYNSHDNIDYPSLVLGVNAPGTTSSIPPMMVTYPQPSSGVMYSNSYTSPSSYYNDKKISTVQAISSYPVVPPTHYQQ